MLPKRWIFPILLGVVIGAGFLGFVLFDQLASAQDVVPAVPALSTPPGDRIIYLVSSDVATTDTLLAPSRLETVLGVQTAHNWSEVSAFDQTAPVEGLIIHTSALSSVDRNWAIDAYRRGVVIAGFNITGAQMGDLVGNPCIVEGGFASSAPNYIIVSFNISGNDLGEISRVTQWYFQECTHEQPLEGISSHIDVAARRSTDVLTNEIQFNQFSYVFADHLNH